MYQQPFGYYAPPQASYPVQYPSPVQYPAPVQYPGPTMPYAQPAAPQAYVAYPVPYNDAAAGQAIVPAPDFSLCDERGHKPCKVFQLQQNFGSPTGNMTVKDESGRVVCRFKGKWISVLDCLVIKDPSRRTIGKVSEKLTTKKLINKPRYTVEAGGLKASMTKDIFTLLRDNFTIRLRHPNGRKEEIQVKSNWFSWEFKFFLNNTLIAAVSKRFVHLTDTYGVALYENNPLDAALILGCAVVIDRVCFGELTLKGFINSASHLPQNPFSRFPVSHAGW